MARAEEKKGLIARDGSFNRATSQFRNSLADPDVEPDAAHPYTMKAGRYILYVSHACPWASRAVLVRSLLQLQDVVELYAVHPCWQFTRPGVDKHCGWVFAAPGTGLVPVSRGAHPQRRVVSLHSTTDGGPHHAATLRELYERAGQSLGSGGRFTTPLLWDVDEDAIVSNESADIISAFNGWAQR
eukprot:Hpha_TRINITY_DN35421_c0_g1::TRINITY_DN35421_c0_g1_i1::g.83342::m.83342/K07393/ECM4, yqjG; glutathionyl-hydroquinone reductase